jgi:DNA-binding LacI/PurR family transcriptional regulator
MLADPLCRGNSRVTLPQSNQFDACSESRVATIGDVAEHAGVSRSTVSYVLSGNRSISAETIRRVEQSIKELKFTPHAGARSIRTRRTGVIAMALPLVFGPHNQVQMPYVWAAMAAAQQAGYKLLMLTDDDGQAAIRDAVTGSMVDGVMVMEVQESDPRIDLLRSLGCPAVLVGTPADAHGLPVVDFDFTAAGRLCAEHLLGLGHTSVGYLGQSRRTFQRRAGFALHACDAALSTLREGGAEASWTACDGTPAGVVRAVDTLFRALPGMTGLIVYNEQALSLVRDRLAELGRRVPGDVSLVAICPPEEIGRRSVSLVAVPLPAEDLARTAVNRLTDLINGRPGAAVTVLSPSLRPGATSA